MTTTTENTCYASRTWTLRSEDGETITFKVTLQRADHVVAHLVRINGNLPADQSNFRIPLSAMRHATRSQAKDLGTIQITSPLPSRRLRQ